MGTSVLIAASNLVHTAKIADWLYVLDHGKIILVGEPKMVFANAEVMQTMRG